SSSILRNGDAEFVLLGIFFWNSSWEISSTSISLFSIIVVTVILGDLLVLIALFALLLQMLVVLLKV
ncbi:23561_t:CDS:1, partial [Cetraspora pellucida]